MIKLDVLTATRAEYGLLRPFIRKLIDDPEIDFKLLVSGAHLSSKLGNTYKEIENDGITIFEKIAILSDKNDALGVSETMANAIVKFTNYFQKRRPDYIFIDGDRYEALAVAIAAINCNVRIIHMGGGATTEGAADEYYRHAITKLSTIHFTSNELYTKRVIQMGEEPERVYTVGSPGLENIRLGDFITKKELEKSIDFSLDKPFAVVTFHPVTNEMDTALAQVEELLKACHRMSDMKFIFTKANADRDGEIINAKLEEYKKIHEDQCIVVASLGSVRYLSALKYCQFVMGNSSSGIIEAPSFGIPSINIGDRQKGRIQAESIINCKPVSEEIIESINRAITEDFMKKCKKVQNPYGDGHTSDKMIKIIKENFKEEINTGKHFYDINF